MAGQHHQLDPRRAGWPLRAASDTGWASTSTHDADGRLVVRTAERELRRLDEARSRG